MASALKKYEATTSVLMLTVCGMIIASGVLNMQQYQLVAVTADASKAEQQKKDADYMDMANKWYGVDTAMGAVLGALILAMMTYQLGKGETVDKGVLGATYVQYIFAFVAYAVIIMNSAYGLNVYKKAPAWAENTSGCKTAVGMRPKLSAMQLRQKAMVSARARLMGTETEDDKAAKYASDVNKVNIAFIVISTVFFAMYIGYIGWNSEFIKTRFRGGAKSHHYYRGAHASRPGAYSTFFTY